MAGPGGKSVRALAQTLGVTLVLVEFLLHQLVDAFTQISRAKAEALFVGPSPAAFADRALIVDFATRSRLPSIFHFRESVELGGLISYGVNLADNFRRAAGYVDKILKGAKPADLPVEQPTKFELVINLVWGVFCQGGSARVLSIFIVGFLVRSESPFPRPDHCDG